MVGWHTLHDTLARVWNRRVWFRASLLLLVCAASASAAQDSVRISGDRLSGVVLPVQPQQGPIELRATRAHTWVVDDTNRLFLEGDVLVRLADHEFRGNEAVVWMNRLPTRDGLVNQIAVYFDRVRDSGKRAGLGAEGRGLLITGSSRGGAALEVTLRTEGRPAGNALVGEGEQRLAEYIRRLLAEPPDLARVPQVKPPKVADQPVVTPGGAPADVAKQAALPTRIELPGDPADQQIPIFVPGGPVTFLADQVNVIEGDYENAVVATGSLVVEYVDDRGREEWDRLVLSAERGVLFTDPIPLTEMATGLRRESVHGIYLEGNVVASDDQYTVRCQRVYYDVERNRAIMLDSVLRTYSREINRPVYARASELRQVAENEWTAAKARISTSEFFTPHISIGASQVTVTQQDVEGPDGRETRFDSRNNTLNIGDTPIFWWPRLSGTTESIPLKGVSIGENDNDGIRIETRWDLYALLGKPRPAGVDTDFKLDGYTERGIGTGLEFAYDFSQSHGLVDVYGMYDTGEDRTSAGRDVEPDREFRGLALWEHREQLGPDKDLFLQLSYISDPTFVTALREDDFEERREYETSAYYRDVSDQVGFTALTQYHLNNFISNDYLLASRQYHVNKVPELTYHRFADMWFDGQVRYDSEYRLSRMQFDFDTSTPRELGLRAESLPGIGLDDEIREVFRERGFASEYVARFDTRHEWTMPLTWGEINVDPFVVGRATAYDSDFEEFSSDADDLRVFGSAGVQFSMTFQRVFNDVQSRLLDLHRLRHIVEPSILLWYGYSDVDQTDLPVYDPEVESIATGANARFGVRNTWQTQRGGPGYWRSVDFLILDTAVVFTSSDTDRESPVPQFFTFRPEYSQFGDHFDGTIIWNVSDTLSLVSDLIYDFDESRVGRGSVGGELRHSPLLSTFVEFRYIDPSDTELLDVGWNYQITPRYRVSLVPQWDFRNDEFRSLRVRLVRSFPEFDFILAVRHDEIRGQTTFSANIGRVEF